MSITLRIGREYLAQAVSFSVSLLDRLVLTGLLLRTWGVDVFANWSIALAASGMVAFFDFGLSLYFSNRITFSVEQGRRRRARHAYQAGNFLMFLAAAASVVAICVAFALWGRRLSGVEVTLELWLTTAFLVLGVSIRMAMSAQYSLYRAYRQYARQSLMLASVDIFRFTAVTASVLAGGGMIVVALAFLIASFLGCVVLFFADTRGRFDGFTFGFQVPNKVERKVIPAIAFGYWLQSAPTILLTSIPVFLIAAFSSNAAAVAQFILIRTIGNFARATLQLFGIVLGQEAGRRVAIRDHAGLFKVYRESSMLLAAQSASAVGVVAALGAPLFTVWTGEARLFDPLLLWVGLSPLLLAPTLILALNLFASVNKPWAIAVARLVQLVLSVALFYLLPLDGMALRMLAALAIGEVLGFGIPITLAVKRIIPEAGWQLLVGIAIRSIVSVGLVYGAVSGVYRVMGGGALALALSLIVAGFTTMVVTFFVGITKERQLVLTAILRSSLAARR